MLNFNIVIPWNIVMIIIWVVIMAIGIIVESQTSELVSIWFAISSAVAIVCAIAGLDIVVQVAVFAILTLVLVIATRPFVKKLTKNTKVSTNADRLIGMVGKVTKDIEADEDTIVITGDAKEYNNIKKALLAINPNIDLEVDEVSITVGGKYINDVLTSSYKVSCKPQCLNNIFSSPSVYFFKLEFTQLLLLEQVQLQQQVLLLQILHLQQFLQQLLQPADQRIFWTVHVRTQFCSVPVPVYEQLLYAY